ncbi:MAG TPA: hypothetical protein DER09_13445 [Prolixibacteraceae bacterium]|nr:hypothetical protein [Prolixibacteraceae bacterium]
MRTTEYPSNQNFTVEGVKHINVADAFEDLQNGEAVMIDVREMEEVQIESFQHERVLNHPMSVIMDRLPYIAKDQSIIVACTSGIRSVKIANLLQYQGFPDVSNLDGGLVAWRKNKLPTLSILPETGCGCHSGDKKPELAIKNPVSKAAYAGNIDFKNVTRI